jgi:hypothetical protein
MQKLISTIILLTLASFSVGAYSGQSKQSICHKGNSITVAEPSVKSHLAHGDTLGSCLETSAEPKNMASVVMMRCDGAVVVSLTSSVNAGELPVEGTCPQVLADLLNNGLKLKSVTGGSGSDEASLLHLYTDYLLIGSVPVVVVP